VTTYRVFLAAMGGQTAIQCLLCGRTSALPGDVENRYCGCCHLFHDAVAAARELHTNGATHECHEWPTARGVCAVCGAPQPAEKRQ